MKRTVLATALLCATSLSAHSADMVFTNASVLTMNDDNPAAEAVAVSGNKIVYVGDAAGAQEHIKDNTEVFDLGGDTLLPGFISGHDHIVCVGLDLARGQPFRRRDDRGRRRQDQGIRGRPTRTRS